MWKVTSTLIFTEIELECKEKKETGCQEQEGFSIHLSKNEQIVLQISEISSYLYLTTP